MTTKEEQKLGKKRLGDLLVDVGIISAEQLQAALQEQKERGGKLGQILMAMGFITEDVLLAFLGKQCNVSYVSLNEYGEIPENVIQLVPETIVRHQKLIPISLEGGELTIAMSDPANVFAVDDLKMMTGRNIRVVIASEAEIKNAIDKYYGAKGSMADILREIDQPGGIDEDVELVKEEDRGSDIIALEAQGEDAPVIKIVNLILSGAVAAGASDVHIEPFETSLRVRYRIDGVLHEVTAPPKKLQNALASRLKIMAKLDIAEHRLPQDGRIKIRVQNKGVDLRVSVLPTAFGEKVVMRLLDPESLKLDLTLLGFDEDSLKIYQKNIDIPYGIILVTGPTGSGKSTTLYSTLSMLNKSEVNIITIEDPVEYVLEGINQVQANAEIGLTFAEGLKSFLRQDPDIIMVGEIRDTETAEIAINAALTGHLVFSTLHTNDAPGAMTRLNNMGIEPFLTTSTVAMVIAQRLVRLVCPRCKEEFEIEYDKIKHLGITPEMVDGKAKVKLTRGTGCDFCSNTGYKGRAACYEVMEVNDKLRDLILERAPTHLIKQLARENGMKTLREAALIKLLNGVTTLEEVMRVTFTDTEGNA
ncbi:MAG: type II secretion system protein GspE [Candidatus Marinimicrobia bacterium CG08_land_8_20_14_0_20_45_22]|nr:MAG: type II secretion system protein GspE [Candidatus Marinimicrobia bacterium CG08_land_8_20_14_0_20_45_22]